MTSKAINHITAEMKLEERAKQMPAPQDGQAIMVKLAVLPYYMAEHRLEAIGYRAGVLLVKRVSAGTNE